MNWRCFSLRLFLFAAAVSACEAPVFAQAFDSGPPTFSPPSVTGPSLTGPPGGSPTAGNQTFVSPTSAPAPLESEPPFSAPPPMEPGVSGAPDVPPGPPSAGPPYGPPSGGPPYGPPPGPPYGPPPYYPPPRSYVPPVYVPPSGPLVIPEVSPLETRFWLRSEYIAWWTKDAPLPTPLVTTGSPSDTVPGALGQPNTQVLYGGQNVDMGVASGWRLDLGMWLDRDQRFGLQAGFFILERQESDFGAFSDGNGYPVLGRPVNLAGGGGQSAYLDSAPGNLVGGAIVTNQSQFFGYEFNGLMKILQNDHFRIDGILGFRYLNLHESTELDDQLYPLTSGALTFLGQPVSTSSTMFDFDRFETTNNFYGGQLGHADGVVVGTLVGRHDHEGGLGNVPGKVDYQRRNDRLSRQRPGDFRDGRHPRQFGQHRRVLPESVCHRSGTRSQPGFRHYAAFDGPDRLHVHLLEQRVAARGPDQLDRQSPTDSVRPLVRHVGTKPAAVSGQHDELLGAGAQRGTRFPLLMARDRAAARRGFLFLVARSVI